MVERTQASITSDERALLRALLYGQTIHQIARKRAQAEPQVLSDLRCLLARLHATPEASYESSSPAMPRP
ncbi:hypothetical protein [Rhodovibrio salinarum]|uniref:Uncharacterized protein n=1 Tax=Rhodovibrio salinarum TaxID=1087 RepID=A0A934UZX3_9PROT|nr:hypothetical protein [Rhodovibrio salinarum]MBK1696971.1 hypothetical protein [Rhodovibrio salinarum]